MSAAIPPMLGEPLSVELANTLFTSQAATVDGLDDAVVFERWLQALAPRLPAEAPGGPWEASALREARRVRDALRSVFSSASAGTALDSAAVATLNEATRAAPSWTELVVEGTPVARRRWAGDARQQLLAVMAADGIALLAGPSPAPVRKCGASGCLLYFVKDHPRRSWCSARCADRARSARHYARRAAQSA